MQPAVPRLEEGDDGGQIIGAAVVGGVVAPPRVRPGGVALLVAGSELDHLRAPLRSAARAAADVVREPDLVEGHGSHPSASEGDRPGDVAGDLRARAAEALGVAGHDVDGDAAAGAGAVEGPGLGPAQHPLATLQDRRNLVRAQASDAAVGPEARNATTMHPRRVGEGERLYQPLRGRRSRHATGVQHAGEGRAEAAEDTAEGVGDGSQHEAPHRDPRQIGEDRGDEIAHAELAGLHELAHRVLGAAEAADQRVADALTRLLRLLGVIEHGLGCALPAGLRRLGRFLHHWRCGGAGLHGLPDRVVERLGGDRRPAECDLRLFGRALHGVAQRLQRRERRGGGIGRGSRRCREAVGPRACLADRGRGLVEGRAGPDRRLAQGEHGRVHAGQTVEAAGRRMQEVGPALLDAGESGQPAGPGIAAQTDCNDSASDRPPSLIRSQTSDATSPSNDSASPKPPAPLTSRANW